MATLLPPRDDIRTFQSIPNSDQAVTEGLGRANTAISPFQAHRTELLERPDTSLDACSGLDATPSYVQGVSLSGVLQMLNLERKTCVLEVASDNKFGTLTLVNGEMADADFDGIEGEDAVYQILSWDRPRTTIMDGVSLFRHTVDLPISQLLLESVRRQDEADRPDRAGYDEAIERLTPVNYTRDLSGYEIAARLSDWKWLVETLIISGASRAAVVRGRDEHLLAFANEYGGSISDPTESEFADLAPVTRSARRWARLLHQSVTEIVVRTGEWQILITPIDREQTLFVYAEIDSEESLGLARSAIRTLNR